MSTPVFEINYSPSGMMMQCPTQYEVEYDVQEVKFRNGYSKRYSRTTTPIYYFETELKYLTSTQKDYIQTFFAARKGKYESFYIYWHGTQCDPTGGSTTNRYLVIFDMDKIEFSTPYRGLYNTKLKFRTVQS